MIVKVSCGHEACTARARGRLTKVEKDKLKPDEHRSGRRVRRQTLWLELRLKTRKQARKALDKGKNVQAKVTVRAKDAAGNVATAKRTIRLVNWE